MEKNKSTDSHDSQPSSKRVRKLLVEHRLSVAEAERITGLSRNTIVNLIHGRPVKAVTSERFMNGMHRLKLKDQLHNSTIGDNFVPLMGQTSTSFDRLKSNKSTEDQATLALPLAEKLCGATRGLCKSIKPSNEISTNSELYKLLEELERLKTECQLLVNKTGFVFSKQI